jgi:hypothetical protein
MTPPTWSLVAAQVDTWLAYVCQTGKRALAADRCSGLTPAITAHLVSSSPGRCTTT